MAKEYTDLFPLEGPRNFSQVWIFGLKKNHLATLRTSTFYRFPPHTNFVSFLRLGCHRFYDWQSSFRRRRRVARFFLLQHTKMGETNHKIY
jgi:hypothetical protein